MYFTVESITEQEIVVKNVAVYSQPAGSGWIQELATASAPLQKEGSGIKDKETPNGQCFFIKDKETPNGHCFFIKR